MKVNIDAYVVEILCFGEIVNRKIMPNKKAAEEFAKDFPGSMFKKQITKLKIKE